MPKSFLVEEDEGWVNGQFIRTAVWTPLAKSETQLVHTALEMKAVASAHQLLIQHYAKHGLVLNLPKPNLADFVK